MHMTSSSDPTSADNAYALDLSPEAILARAGRQHAMLDRMAVLGMRLVEEVVQRAVDAPHHPEVKHEPTRAFAQVTRAVRFTLALQTRIEARMIAIRNVKSTASIHTKNPDNEAPVGLDVSRTAPCSIRQRARDAVTDAIDFEISVSTIAERALDRLYENLVERETYDALLTLPFRECVAAICADLGLDPDWSRWSDDTGFAEPSNRRRRDWRTRWTTPRSADDELQRSATPSDKALRRKPTIQLEPA
jgi:hypothetical protein